MIWGSTMQSVGELLSGFSFEVSVGGRSNGHVPQGDKQIKKDSNYCILRRKYLSGLLETSD